MIQEKHETRDGMRIDWDAPIKMDDGIVLRADVFRPQAEGKYSVILSMGPYGKGMPFGQARPHAWERLIKEYPEVITGTSAKYATWELADPEHWVPDGYVLIRVDSRGAGRSEGKIECWSPREAKDLYDCIEWAAVQPWSSGKVGLNGISYFAINQWHVAALQPPHLTAICAWEGAADYYRDITHHGGLYSEFAANWYPRAVITMQHGVGDKGGRNPVTGELVSGPETLSPEELAKNRADFVGDAQAHPLDDDYHKSRSPDWSKITVPMLSAGNWGGQGMHLRGNTEAFMRAASPQKWLEIHGGAHWAEFYTSYGVALQKRFFGHFLKGEDTGWSKQPPVQLKVRSPGEKFEVRGEENWPIPRTKWTRFHLHAEGKSLSEALPADTAALSFEAQGDGVTFLSEPMAQATEITGPLAAKLFVSSSTSDADIFVIFRAFDPQGKEVVFQGAQDPRTPIGQGWLRMSHYKLDRKLSLPYRPYHTHDESWPITPDEVIGLDIEIWPTSIVVPKGYRIGLTVRGKDYAFDGPPLDIPGAPHSMTGVGPFLHVRNRPPEIFNGTTTLHFAPGRQPYLLLPVIPAK